MQGYDAWKLACPEDYMPARWYHTIIFRVTFTEREEGELVEYTEGNVKIACTPTKEYTDALDEASHDIRAELISMGYNPVDIKSVEDVDTLYE